MVGANAGVDGVSGTQASGSAETLTSAEDLLSPNTMVEEEFKLDERILCYHGPLIYEAKIIRAEIRRGTKSNGNNDLTPCMHFLVHYKGWKSTWDEWAPAKRLLKFNDENLRLQKLFKDQHLPGRIVTPLSTSGLSDTAKATGVTQSKRTHSEDGPKSANSKPKKRKPAGSDAGSEKTTPASTNASTKHDTNLTSKIIIPQKLKLYLVDDWERVTSLQKLVPLPRRPSVSDLLQEYKLQRVGEETTKSARISKMNQSQSTFEELMKGFALYFDTCLGSRLLYRFERQQYVDVYQRLEKERAEQQSSDESARQQSHGMPLSTIYGVEHLLRMLVIMPDLIAEARVNTETTTYLTTEVSELAKWLNEPKQSRLFLDEYENADPHYLNLTKSPG